MSKGLYIHIPFCVKKCNYCDFLSAPATDEIIEAYVKELIEEIKYKSFAFENIYDEDSNDVDTIFIGGGTPSILSGKSIKEIMKAVDKNFYIMPGAEITMEVNPGTLSLGNEESVEERLAAWKDAGINRISMGLQSANDEELKELGRIHDYNTFKENFENLRAAGFNNINVDLMSALPYQTVESYESTLRTVCELGPEHISAYSLIIEEGTPFFEKYSEDCKRREAGEKPTSLPSEEDERKMYEITKSVLGEYGYSRYEISNYAKPGYECKHNIRYWKREEYLGLGLGASSLIGNKRYKNLSDLDDYLGLFTEEEYLQYVSMYDETEELDINARKEEFMFLGLRMMEGVNSGNFDEEFGPGEFEKTYGDKMKDLENKGLVESVDKINWKLTTKGIDVSNVVLAEFLIE